MNLSDDQKLETFLRENRPLHPRHSETEARRIWAHVVQEKKPSHWDVFSFRKAFATSAAGVGLLLFMVYMKPQTIPQPKAPSAKEVALIEESMDLSFLENGELYEVTDLLSLSK